VTYEDATMDLYAVASREWDNIRTSLELCGDIGPFDERLLADGSLDDEEREEFMANLADFAETVGEHGYGTLESMDVYCILVRLAARRLGLTGEVATAFANGYSFVRTGWGLDTFTSIEQNIFYKMFFQSREDYGWEFSSDQIKKRLKEIFDKFMRWEKDRVHYREEIDNYQEMKQDEALDAD